MTDRDQQDREAFEEWCPHDRFNAIRQQAWQASLAYERGKSGWLPIETAPKKNGYRCMGTDGTDIFIMYYVEDGDFSFWQRDEGYAESDVSHWQPLPSPPATQPQESE